MCRLSLLLVLLAALLAEKPVHACAAPGPAGTLTAIASEAAVIVWDARTHTEHFIRGANFESSAPSFGFLVPTPTPPQLAPAGESAFYQLDAVSQPRTIRRRLLGLKLTSWLIEPNQERYLTGTATLGTAPPAVEVLNTQHVRGYDAVTLRANDPAALTAWLKAHGYAVKPSLNDWLRPYVARSWAITAFKIAKSDAQVAQIGLPVVRMSFKTDRPFFPYSEPADQRQLKAYLPDRILRLYVLSSVRMHGALDSASVHWPGQVRLAQTPPDFRTTTQSQLEAALGLRHTQMPAPLWLTVSEDRASPRPGVADLYFLPSAQDTPLVPPPIYDVVDERIGIPVEPIIFVLALLIARVAGVRHRAKLERA